MKALSSITKEFFDLLVKNNLLERLVSSEIINEITSSYEIDIDDKKKNQIKQSIINTEKIESEDEYIKWLEKKNISEEKLLNDFMKPMKLDSYCLEKYSHMAESRFLKRKDSLEIITYSLIRVKEMFLAQELYLRIKDNPSELGNISSSYSIGHEKNSKGVIGPVSMSQGDPRLMQLLKKSKIGELNQPCRIDNVWIITRVEFLKGAVLDDKTRLLLCKEIFNEWLQQSISKSIKELQINLNHA